MRHLVLLNLSQDAAARHSSHTSTLIEVLLIELDGSDDAFPVEGLVARQVAIDMVVLVDVAAPSQLTVPIVILIVVEIHGLAPDLIFLGIEIDDLGVLVRVGDLSKPVHLSSRGITAIGLCRVILLLLLAHLFTSPTSPFAIRGLTLPLFIFPNFFI